MGGEVCNSYHVSVLYCYLIEAPLKDHVCNLVSIILLSIVIVVAFTDSTYASCEIITTLVKKSTQS